jgi:23S rRNA (cytidine1920-2'-O)/16S rRNA (cytidine1409-2'-O)-methyltransferase
VIDLAGKVCLDVGASTGGFTDCMLRHGARRVYAVEAGNGQLHSGGLPPTSAW